MVEQQETSEDQQTHQDSSSWKPECLHKISQKTIEYLQDIFVNKLWMDWQTNTYVFQSQAYLKIFMKVNTIITVYIQYICSTLIASNYFIFLSATKQKYIFF